MIIPGSADNDNHSISYGTLKIPNNLTARYPPEFGTGIISVQDESIFDIRLVTKAMLDQIRSNPGTDGILLKIKAGIPIGLITPEVLYIRADFSEDFFPDIPVNITKDDISRHLIDIVFGSDNANIFQFKSDKKYKFFLTDQYTAEDISLLLSFAHFFNNISNTAEFEEDEIVLSFLPGSYNPEPYYYYRISIVSPEIFKEVEKNKKPDEINLRTNTGKIIGVVTTDHLILSDILAQQEKKYFILRGLIISLGFHGETTRYSDSFFSKGSSMQTSFSPIDTEAMKLMYGGRLQSGMTIEATEKALNLYLVQKKKIIGE